MIKFENEDIVGFDHAIRGMRNPMNSWDKSDSLLVPINESIEHDNSIQFEYKIGEADHDLMMKLRNAGTDHRKYMRMITVYVDITAPLYWWKEFDTYKVGTVANSCSTMHKIHEKKLTIDDFSHEHITGWESDEDIFALPCSNSNSDDTYEDEYDDERVLNLTIIALNHYRNLYLKTKDKRYWDKMIQLLPSSYNQRRTVMLNYEVLANMYKSRKNHKLQEWRDLCEWIKTLPYSEIITGEVKEDA